MEDEIKWKMQWHQMVFGIWLSYHMVASLLGASESLRLKETLMIKCKGMTLDLLPKGLIKKKELITHRHYLLYPQRILLELLW